MKIIRIRATVPLLNPGDKAVTGANQGWRADNAIRVSRATKDLEFFPNQPCRSTEDCQQLRRMADQRMKPDECETGLHAAQRIVADRGAGICWLRISSLGGLSEARRLRDCLVENRFPAVSKDRWGAERTSATVTHFAASTPQDHLQNTTGPMACTPRSTGIGGPVARGGKLFATNTPGLGVTPDFASLDAPVDKFGAPA